MRPLVIVGMASLAGLGCYKTPSPPGVCPVVQHIPDLPFTYQLQHSGRVAKNLDSLRAIVRQATSDQVRDHLVQEYLLAANQLPKPARDSAMQAVQPLLVERKRP